MARITLLRVTGPGTYLYDANGNLTQEGSASYQYKYDAENRLVNFNNGADVYTYLGAGRVKKVYGTTTMVYITSGSKIIAMYANGALHSEYVYAGNRLLAQLTPSGTPFYYHPDHLSNRVMTDASAGVQWTAGNFPYGESWYQPVGNTPWRFTSYLRDSESGNDYAIFRSYQNRIGRFSSPDPVAGSIRNPQSLNRYAYVQNDPLNYRDPLGLFYSPTCDGIWLDGNCIPGGFGGMLVCFEVGCISSSGGIGGGGGGQGDLGPSVKPTLFRTVLEHPDCAALFGGVGPAAVLIAGTRITNLDEKTAGLTGQEQAIVDYHVETGAPIAGTTPGNTIGVFNSFYSIYPDVGQQVPLFFHELEHNQGMPPHEDVQAAVQHAAEVEKKCPFTEVELVAIPLAVELIQ